MDEKEGNQTPASTASKPWRCPGQWLRDEKFWRDVTARAMSGLIIAFVLYLFAVFGGYIKPLNLAWVATVYIGGFMLLFSFAIYYGDWTMSAKFPDKWRFRRFALLRTLTFMVTGAVFIGLVWFVAWLISLVWH